MLVVIFFITAFQEKKTIEIKYNIGNLIKGKPPAVPVDYDLTHNWSSSYLTKKVKAREKIGRTVSRNNEFVVSGKWAKYLFAMAKNQLERAS